nr:uncharacterized protein LOC127313837 isoform X2 [Lolium perenne]
MAGASTTTSLLLAPPRFSYQIAGRLPVPAPRIRPRRRFAAARGDFSLVPSWQLRAPPRRRNVLRDKASPPLADHQVRPPNHEALDPHHDQSNTDRPPVDATGGPQSSFSDDPALPPDLGNRLGKNFDRLDAGRSGDAVAESNLNDGQKGLGRDAEEGHFCGTGTRPVFSVYGDPDGTAVVRVEVNEDGIASRSEAADGEVSADSQSILSRARVMAREFEREVPRNSSLVRFVATERKEESCVADAEVSVGQRDGAPLMAVAWSGFAAFCGVCVLLVASKVVWRNVKARLSGNVFRVPIPWVEDGRLDDGNIKVFSDVHVFPGDLLGRPRLQRVELMSNLKKAKASRERFSFRNVFSCNTVANDVYASMMEFGRMVTDVNTLEEGSLGRRNAGKNSLVVFPPSVLADVHTLEEGSVSQRNAGKVAIEEGISASYARQSVYQDDVSELDSNELRDINLSNDIIDESVEQSVDLKNVASTADSIVKSQYNVGEIEQPERRYNDEEDTTEAKNRTSVLYATEKEAHICSADDHNAGPNGIDTLSAEFERKEQFTEIVVSSIQELKLSVSFSGDKQMVYKNGNAHQISNNVVPETADDFSPNLLNITSSELKHNGAYLANGENDVSCMQVEAPTAFPSDAKTANCDGFAHCVSIKSKEAFENLVMTDISTMKSPQRIREEHVDLMSDNMQEPYNHDGKQIIYANEKDHKINVLHNETETSSETYPIETLDKASMSSSYSIQEEAVQHKDAKVSKPEKQEKITSSNIEATAYLKKDKGELQKETCSDKVPEIMLLAEDAPGTGIVVGLSNVVQKTKRVARKRLKKVQSNQGAAEQDIVHNSSMVDQESSSQNVKTTRRKNQTKAFGTPGSQTREEIPEIALMASFPDDAPKAENTQPLGEEGSSAGTLSSKDIFRGSQSSRLIARSMRKEELKLNFQTSERVEATAPETKTNMHGYNVVRERSTDVNKLKPKMGVAAAKKSTKRSDSSSSRSSGVYFMSFGALFLLFSRAAIVQQ